MKRRLSLSAAVVALASIVSLAGGNARADGPGNEPVPLGPPTSAPPPPPAAPDSAPAAESDTDNSGEGVEKVVVTATRRETVLQKTPIAITVVGDKAIKAANVENIEDLVSVVPSLVVTNNGNSSAYTARIRGIGTQGNNPGLEASVGTFIDGVYRNRAGVAAGDLGELERIEILRGPQGTLFGRNTSAGILSIITKKPSFVNEAQLEATVGSFDQYGARGSANFVLAEDELAARIFFTRQEREGFIDVNPGRPDAYDGNATSYFSGRGQLLWQASANADLRIIGDYSERDDQCCSAVTIDPGGNGRTPLPASPFFLIGTAGPTIINTIENPLKGKATSNQLDALVAYGDHSTDTHVQDKGISAELNWDMDGAKLTSITALRDWKAAYGQDADFSGADLLFFADDGRNFNKFETFSHETRLTGETGWVNWLFGVYYADEDLTRRSTLSAGSEFESFMSLHRVGDTPGALRTGLVGLFAHPALSPVFLPTVPGQSNDDLYEQNAESFALFTHNVFHLDDDLDLIAGLRWTTEKKDYDATYRTAGSAGCASIEALYGLDPVSNVGFNNPGVTVPELTRKLLAAVSCQQASRRALDVLTATTPHHQEREEDEFSGVLTLAWEIEENIHSYATYSRGHKAGGFNLDRAYQDDAGSIVSSNLFAVPPGPVPAQIVRSPDTSFETEFVDAFELGLKTSLDGNLFVNTAIFYQKFENFQLNTFTGTSFIVASVPEVISQGVEVEAFWAPVRGLTTVFAAQYTDAHYGDLGSVTAPGTFLAKHPEFFLLDEATVSSAPEWTLTGALDYSFPFIDALTARFHTDARWQSETNTGSNLDPRKVQGDYAVVGLKLGVYSEGEKVGLEFFARNLFDERYINASFDSTLQGSAVCSASVPTCTAPSGTSTIDAFVGEPRMIGATLRIKN